LPNVPPDLVPDRSCDLIWSSLALHHVEHPADSIKVLAAKLKPGGTMAILESEFGPGFPATIWPPEIELLLRGAWLRAWQERPGYHQDEFHLDPFAARNVPTWFAQAGLELSDISAVSDATLPPLTAADSESIHDWFRHQVDHLAAYLAPRDLVSLSDLFDPDSPKYMLNQPGFFWIRTMFLIIGQKEA
jgi:SAM-dependent methyltransferase